MTDIWVLSETRRMRVQVSASYWSSSAQSLLVQTGYEWRDHSKTSRGWTRQVTGSWRELLLHLAHTIPWARHLGHPTTCPSPCTDVKTYCKTCVKTQCCLWIRPSSTAAAYHLIEGDCRGRCGAAGKKLSRNSIQSFLGYYAAQFPPAFPPVTASKCISALQPFSHWGILVEILTDQGTSFTPRLMSQSHVHITQTLMAEHWRGRSESLFLTHGRIWIRGYSVCALFTVPQASTEFSPSDLFYPPRLSALGEHQRHLC